MNEYVKSGILVALGGLVMWGLTKFTDQADIGAEAEVKRLAGEVFNEKIQTDSGVPLTQVVDNNTKELIKINTQLPSLIKSLEALSED